MVEGDRPGARVCTRRHTRLVYDWSIGRGGLGMATVSAFEAKTRFGELQDAYRGRRSRRGREVEVERVGDQFVGHICHQQRLDLVPANAGARRREHVHEIIGRPMQCTMTPSSGHAI